MSADINVLAELERIGWKYEYASDAEIKVLCPLHEDSRPSCSLNVERRVFKCQTAGCEASGTIIDFLAAALKVNKATVLADLRTRYDFDTSNPIDIKVIERYHAAIWNAAVLLKELYNRGITDELIRKYRLGEHDGRIQIPIPNEHRTIVNLRKYLPGAPGPEKMRNAKGRGSPARWFPIEQLKYKELVLCGGEIKAIAAAAQLNRHGIGAITTTAGEGNWEPRFTKDLKGKVVYVCMDVDEPGQQAAQERCLQLHHAADWVGNLTLPLDVDRYPHGDVNDFVAGGGRLKPLLKAVKQFEPVLRTTVKNEAAVDTLLHDAVHAKSAGRRMRIRGVPTAMDDTPYVVPQMIRVKCDKSHKTCSICPVMAFDMDEFKIDPEAPAIIDMIAAKRTAQHEAICIATGVPKDCKACRFEVDKYYNVEDVRVSPQLEITHRSAGRMMQPAFCIGDGVDLNETYEFTGRMWPHPDTQQSTLIISSYKPTTDALSTYAPEDLKVLREFQPDDWCVEGIQAKLDSLYADLEANVSRIYERRDLHLVVDLTYHSPLLIEFDGHIVKGWTESLVLGDSAQGKSETALNLMRHYGLGEKVECKNATVAGLLGGLQQLGGRWFVTWGIIPTHDRRLVVLEELKGTSIDVIGKLTDMRSSGIAQIPKIEKRQTHARTRLLALSNPRSDATLQSYNYGVEAIRELVGNPEDIRRFDLCYIAAATDIDPGLINKLQSHRPHVDATFTSELCRSLILWTWTREPTQVVFEDKQHILETATQLCAEFTDLIPIVDRGSMRHKLSRLAAALAGRTFSTAESDEQMLLVRKCHVEYIAAFLRRIYNGPVFGYGEFTRAVKAATNLKDRVAVNKQINMLPFPGYFVDACLETDIIDLQDIQDWCSYERAEAQTLLSFLVRYRCLRRDGRRYRKTAPFIDLLRAARSDGKLKDRPDFIEEEEF